MKVLVTVKRVVDYNVNVRVLSDHSGVDLNNVKMSVNPFDEIAIEVPVRSRFELLWRWVQIAGSWWKAMR